MFFDYNDEQKDLQASIRRFLAEFQPVSAARQLVESETGYDPVVWRKLAGQLGLQGLHLPERFGGSDGSDVELGIAFTELGRVMYAGPFLATVGLAANMLLISGDEVAMAEYLPQIADGSLIATAAMTEDTFSGLPAADAVTADRREASYQLTGALEYVLDGAVADLILVPASTPDSSSLFAVRAGDRGVRLTALGTVDGTRRYARLELAATPARLIGTPGAAAGALMDCLDLARIALAAEQVGGARACLDMAVGYAGQRVQFGRQIGSFQAIKHKCATMLLEVECAAAAAQYAAWSAATRQADLAAATAVAQSYCSDAFFHAAAQNVQIHGGIGFTWEHDAHLYFKRAKASQLLFGHPDYHREQLASLMGL
jgi:alkylation response protein AidB-like acyl-CoA dehydrogenase